jgi:hypothetical protein
LAWIAGVPSTGSASVWADNADINAVRNFIERMMAEMTFFDGRKYIKHDPSLKEMFNPKTGEDFEERYVA